MKRRDLIRIGLASSAAGIFAPATANAPQFGFGVRNAHAEVPNQDDFDELRMRRHDLLTGGEVDVADPDVAEALSRIDEEAGPLAAALIRDPDRRDLWADLPLPGTSGGSFNLTDTYQRLRVLATAWATPGTELHADADLVADIVQALDLLYQLYYNEDGDQTGNWWHWEIGIPRRIVDTCTLVYPHIPEDQLAGHLRAVDRYCPDPDRRTYSPEVAETGANRTDKCVIVAMRGVLGRDESKVELARDGMSDVRDDGLNSLFKYVTSGDGFYEDGSFIQHRYIAYTGTYGNVLLSGVAEMTALLGDSPWEVSDPDRAVIYDAVERSFAPVIFDLLLMDCVSGRAISRQGTSDYTRGRSTATATLLLATGVPDDYADPWRRLVKGWATRSQTSSFYAGLNLPSISLAKSVLDDPTIEPAPPIVGAFVFADMDRVVHRRPDWAYAISMSSSRIARNESANGENKRGWYLGEGMTYLYNDDLTQYNDDYWPTVDAYRLPGTTIDTRPNDDLAGGAYYPRPPTPWAGGAVLDASYAAAGMELIAQDADLHGRKAWFCLDDAVVALGAGITGTSDHRLPPTADARVNAGSNADVNYGSHTILLVKTASENLTRESFLAFDISELPSTIESAELVFWARVNDGGGSESDVDVHAVNAAWDEDTVTWNTKPAMLSRLDTVAIDSEWNWRAADITGYVLERQQAGADRAGFGIRQSPPAGTTGLSVEIFSRENSDNRPYLRLRLSEPTTTVETIVENRNLHADGDNTLVIDGETTPSTPDWQELFASVDWAHLSGVAGYVFPGGAPLHAARVARTGAWSDISSDTVPGDPTPITRRYATLWHDHGADPSDATYAYILLPGATATATEQYAADPPVEILANADHAQAIKVGRLGLISAILWEGGMVDIDDSTVTSDGPAAIVMRQRAGEIRVAIADPSRTMDTLTVTLPWPANRIITADPTITLEPGNGPARLRVTVGGSRGYTHSAVLAIDARS